jgi:tRNA(Arg) A34 adenosine deaminase TadA
MSKYKYESEAYQTSSKLKNIHTKQHFGCLITKRQRILCRSTNQMSAEHSPSCSFHAEMGAIYQHLRQLGRWEEFYTLLKYSHERTGVFSRMEGKASESVFNVIF